METQRRQLECVQAAFYPQGFAAQEPSKAWAVAVARGGQRHGRHSGVGGTRSHAAGQRAPGTGGSCREQSPDEKPTHLCQVVPRLGNSGRVEEQRFRMDSA